jgi:hypothetical protein
MDPSIRHTFKKVFLNEAKAKTSNLTNTCDIEGFSFGKSKQHLVLLVRVPRSEGEN